MSDNEDFYDDWRATENEDYYSPAEQHMEARLEELERETESKLFEVDNYGEADNRGEFKTKFTLIGFTEEQEKGFHEQLERETNALMAQREEEQWRQEGQQ